MKRLSAILLALPLVLCGACSEEEETLPQQRERIVEGKARGVHGNGIRSGAQRRGGTVGVVIVPPFHIRQHLLVAHPFPAGNQFIVAAPGAVPRAGRQKYLHLQHQHKHQRSGSVQHQRLQLQSHQSKLQQGEPAMDLCFFLRQ